MRKLIIVLFFLCICAYANSQFFYKEFLNCTALLEVENPDGSLKTHGTGFFLYNYSNPEQKLLVTCEHVLRNSYVYISLALTDSGWAFLKSTGEKNFNDGERDWSLEMGCIKTKYLLTKGKTFVANDSLDIGVLKLATGFEIRGDTGSFKLTETKAVGRAQIQNKQSTELGMGVYFIGFPFNIGGNEGFQGSGMFRASKANPALRKGIVSWKSNDIDHFLIDGFSYGGNSGSPVFTEAPILGNRQPSLIGMVQGHLSDPRFPPGQADFNYGLARCVWVDKIIELAKKIE